jgi:hypothetical protein
MILKNWILVLAVRVKQDGRNTKPEALNYQSKHSTSYPTMVDLMGNIKIPTHYSSRFL